MALYLDTRGKPRLTVAICDRCHMKKALVDLRPDGDSPGLQVCDDCRDVKDPYKLPPRRPEDISVPNPRTEEPLE